MSNPEARGQRHPRYGPWAGPSDFCHTPDHVLAVIPSEHEQHDGRHLPPAAEVQGAAWGVV